MTKELKKAMMTRARLKNSANKTNRQEDIDRYKAQRNLVVKLNRNEKRNFFANLDPTAAGKDKNFWKTFKPLFSEKSSNGNQKIILVENDAIRDDETEISNIFNKYFVNITDTLPIEKVVSSLAVQNTSNDVVANAIKQYENHPCIINIKRQSDRNEIFEFTSISPLEVWEEVNKLDSSKKTSGEISTDVVELISGYSLQHLTYFINKMFTNNEFPGKLKLADIPPIFKSGESTQKGNYRPMSVLPALSKLFKRIMIKQIQPFTNKFLSKLLCAFRNGHNSQHALFSLNETCRKTLDEKGVVGMVPMDLSKAYDCLPHDLLIAKLAAYKFGPNSLALISNYLSQRKQRVKVGSKFSEWQEIVSGVPQGSVLGPLLLNIFVNDFNLAMKSTYVCNFADDNTIYACDKNAESVAARLEDDVSRALDWFKSNRMVANPQKFQAIFLGLKQNQEFLLEIGNIIVKATRSVKLLGIPVDDEFKFEKHVKTQCQKVYKKVGAFSRAAPYMDEKKGKILYHTFIMSNFNYFPLIWMFCGKTQNKEIDRVHKRALRILFNDYTSSFEELLQK